MCVCVCVSNCGVQATMNVLGYRYNQGLKDTTQNVLGVEFRKSKTTTRSNWATAALNRQQIRYAALDVISAGAVSETRGVPCHKLSCTVVSSRRALSHLFCTGFGSLTWPAVTEECTLPSEASKVSMARADIGQSWGSAPP